MKLQTIPSSKNKQQFVYCCTHILVCGYFELDCKGSVVNQKLCERSLWNYTDGNYSRHVIGNTWYVTWVDWCLCQGWL